MCQIFRAVSCGARGKDYGKFLFYMKCICETVTTDYCPFPCYYLIGCCSGWSAGFCVFGGSGYLLLFQSLKPSL
ncbi:hypothetical protein XELAEV_18011157mg [Xenopus laevis]|uniref:Uncharacterized protein n=1 Tax=Xenopus laevis TaxID=8355 RepID=A0A974DWR2_XENLA|nr:hypothetical protein XELAEV_18011157mg [Xenopus laevis]